LKQLNHILPKPHAWLVGAVILYLLSFLFADSFSPTRSFKLEINKLEDYIHTEQKKFNALVADTSLIQRLAQRTETINEFKKLIKNKTGLFVFNKSLASIKLSFWSNQKIYPPDDIFGRGDTVYFKQIENGNGFYICVKKTFAVENDHDSIVTVGMIPIMYHYFVNLPDRFEYSEDADSKILISGLPTDYPVKSLSGDTLFYVSPKIQPNKPSENLATYLKLTAVLLLLIYIHFMAEKTAKQYGFWKGLIFLFVVLMVLRLVSYYSSVPINLRQFQLFDPKVYGSNLIHKSLGDLLINAILFCWIILFAWQKLDKTGFYNVPAGKKGTIIGCIASLFVVVLTFLISYIIRSIAADSSISFDVINFFSLSPYTVFGFIALSILAVGYYYFMRIMIPLLSIAFRNNFYPVYLVVAVAGLTFLTFEVDNALLVFYIVVLGWLIFYIWLSRLDKFGINYQRQTMAGALFWIFLFSASITAVIIDANREKEWQSRIALANRIDDRTDPYNEKELGVSFAYIDNDFLAPNFYRFRNEDLATFLRDSIMHKSDFPFRYNSRLYVFDADKKPLFNEGSETFNTLETKLLVRAKETTVDSLYYFDKTFDKYTFIFKQSVTDANRKPLGYLYILSDPEQNDNDAIVAELFKESDIRGDEQSEIYSYGIYLNGVLSTGPRNKYPFSTILDSADVPDETILKKTTETSTELWYKASGNKIVVVARNRDNALEAITLFSYIFCVFLFLVAFFNLLLLLLRIGGNVKELRKIVEWNIRTQIHGTIIFVSILSFVIIGVSTISFFILRYKRNNEDRLSKTMEVMIKEMEKRLDDRQALDDQLAIYDSVSNGDVQNLVNDVAEIHGVDVNVYDTSGTLHVTSQPVIYRENFLSNKMDPNAFYFLNKRHQVQHVQQEKLAHISYMSTYAPLRGKDGIAYAYIHIPYFLSQQELKQEISNFLVTIINLNAFIFLIAGVIALFITNRVTRSFLLISEKMRDVSLGKTNEEIEWKRNDEIGGLVREYNKMVNKLEVSADALAKSEREGAWREMARQVAHEIKNPLTPMKLSIQFLQKSIDNNSDNVKELTGKVAKTLVEQIDHLSKIAFDFSQFANIGNTNIETFDINEVIRSLDNLYKTSHEGELKLHTVPGKVMVRADKTQMNRLFTNLIQNAIEACNGKGKCSIELNEVQTDGVVQISIKDNGEGIPVEMQSKIFVPNFTTKSSGTGLGLAMCKGIAEQAGGRIWFETSTGEGSTFYVELPVAN
jgi:two-component system, NtrC family, nitrogen regulation sensor histidine kinase NtrY